MASILVVDDTPDMLWIMAEYLEMHGHRVRRSQNGVEALHALDEEFPQLVITDVEMPVLDGPAMIMRMFVEDLGRENIPVILVSGGVRVDKIAKTVGTPYFLEKPFSPAELIDVVDRALAEAIPPRPPALLV